MKKKYNARSVYYFFKRFKTLFSTQYILNMFFSSPTPPRSSLSPYPPIFTLFLSFKKKPVFIMKSLLKWSIVVEWEAKRWRWWLSICCPRHYAAGFSHKIACKPHYVFMDHRLERKPGWQLVGDRQGWLHIHLFDIVLTGKCEQLLLFFKKLKINFCFVCENVCFMYICTSHACLVFTEAGREHGFPWNWRGFWANKSVLGTQPGSSGFKLLSPPFSPGCVYLNFIAVEDQNNIFVQSLTAFL